ncbi:hypothetical protein AVDCRST_MAG84-2622, partial [uncultured Microcoleus sp.]
GFWILDFGLIPRINPGACTIKKFLVKWQLYVFSIYQRSF